MLSEVLTALQCPVCQVSFAVDMRTDEDLAPHTSLTCTNGHSFDRARQGYVNMLVGRDPGTGDDADMVARRAAFLGAGHYAPIAEVLPSFPGRTSEDASDISGLVVEVGAGTGYYLSHVLDRSPGTYGLALDVSKFAARRAARAHRRAEAIVADCWGRLPLADSSVDVLLDVFAPRNAAEFARVVNPGGVLAVVTPLPEHLAEIRQPLGMLAMEDNKTDRVRESLASEFVEHSEIHVRRTMSLTRREVVDLVGMGPSARHTNPAERIAGLPERIEVSLAVRLGLYAPRPRARAPR
ncbi:MAG: methyltransferase domain-containing protein [Longispora sp.]|nr:methyltransferase domain-containing protein [Longispora sp. (in: high G+C Gram-positive bacteria)]